METPTLRGFRISSARRPPSRGALVLLIVVGGGVLVGSIIAGKACHQSPTDVSGIPGLPPRSPTATATATATPTNTSTPVYARFVEPMATFTPTPWPTLPPIRRPPPTPTPRISECVAYRWETIEAMPAPGHIMIQVRATNRCRRDLSISDVGFEAVAWRDGSVQITRRAYPLEPVRRGRSFDVVFDLPGSTSWYDRVELFILDPG